MLRVGPFVLTTRRWLDGFAVYIGREIGAGAKKRIAQQEAVIARQGELLRAALSERDLFAARYREANETVGELTTRLDHLGGRP